LALARVYVEAVPKKTAGDVVAVQLALAGEDGRDSAFAAEFRGDVALREPAVSKEKTQHVVRLGGRDGVA
jgi:hypothetical protein